MTLKFNQTASGIFKKSHFQVGSARKTTTVSNTRRGVMICKWLDRITFLIDRNSCMAYENIT